MSGLRVTASRIAVLDALASTSHLDADQLYHIVARTLPHTSVQSMHNVVSTLTSAGLLRRIEPAGSPALYERRVGDNHCHVVCRECGAVEDVDRLIGHLPRLDAKDAHGYAVDMVELNFWGLCPACRPSDPPSQT